MTAAPPKLRKGERECHGFILPSGYEPWQLCLQKFGINKGEEKLRWFKLLVGELWPEPVFMWDRWADLFFGALCGAKGTVERVTGAKIEADYPWWEQMTSTGAAGTGKSSRAAMWILCNWMCAREHTTCMLTSTSVTALRQRIWSELIDWIQKCRYRLDGPPTGLLQIVPSDTIIRWSEKDTKSAIFGRAVDQGGSVDNAVGRIKGIHNRRVFVVTDEMTAMPEAISKACRNLDSGTIEFQFIGLGNATDYTDQHGLYSEPIGGWNSITVEDEFWLTKLGGCCVHLDGHKSPALAEPEKFHFYIGRKKLDKDARFFGGENTPDYWRECRGFWAPAGLSNTVMDASLLAQFNTRDAAIWKSGWEMGAGFDVAFEGGDRRVLYPFRFGEFASGVKGMEFRAPIIVNIDMTQDKRFIHYGIAQAVEEACNGYQIDGKAAPIPPQNLACDVTSEGAGPFGIMSASWSREIIPVEFGGGASKTPIAADRPTTWHELYGNKVTEIWYSMRRFIEGGQVRGLTDDETIRELTSRERFMKGGKTHVQPKSEMKKMKARSPDKADAAALAFFVLRHKGILPAGIADNIAVDATAWNTYADRVNIEDDTNDYADYGF